MMLLQFPSHDRGLFGIAREDRISLFIEFHSEGQSHAIEDLDDLDKRGATEILRRQKFLLGLLDQFPHGADVCVLQAVVRADREFELVDRTVEVFVLGEWRPGDVLVAEILLLLLEVDEDRHVVLDDFRCVTDRILRLDRTIRPNLDGEFVVFGVRTHSRLLDGVVDLADRRVDRIHRNVSDREVFVVVVLG